MCIRSALTVCVPYPPAPPCVHTGSYFTANWVQAQRYRTGDPPNRANTTLPNTCLVMAQ
jgi:hypothetical protein